MHEIEVVKEIRFAVVMYGGVSLAIYINGVAQELMRMVRATAVNEDVTEFRYNAGELDESERIYRYLSYIISDQTFLGNQEELNNLISKIKENKSWEDKLEEIASNKKDKPAKIVRFVVDVISGSSAGGINGIFMAKALANGQKIKKLEDVWNNEGDFTRLLCDEESISDITERRKSNLYEAVKSPPSLLNSQRMYIKLLKAFYDMDVPDGLENDINAPKSANSFVDEVDLFVTTTDFWGIPVPIRLFDRIIYERRHRQNFHLRYRKDDRLNEFAGEYYPFLAYIARCTSSFPVAFDPMQFEKTAKIISGARKYLKQRSLSEEKINQFFNDNLKRFFKPETVQDSNGEKYEIEWEKRVFADGGALDNKPFEYALKALDQKQSDVSVERKLIYIEPQPEQGDLLESARKSATPGVIDNVFAQAMNLPGYETISEDLHKVLQRNRLVTRVNHLVSNARKDELNSFELSFDDLKGIIRRNVRILNSVIENNEIKWENLNLKTLAQLKGQSIYPYYRLRVAALTDDLARMVTHRAGYDENSDYFLAVRDLVHIWRENNFSRGEDETGANANANENSTPLQFLRNYDYNYRLRRLHFVLRQADRLLRFENDLQTELEKTGNIAEALRNENIIEEIGHEPNQESEHSYLKLKALQTRFSLIETGIYKNKETSSEIILKLYLNDREKLDKTVRSFKRAVNVILQDLRRNLRQIEPNAVLVLNADIDKLNEEVREITQKIGIKELEEILGKVRNQGNQIDTGNNYLARRNRAKVFLDENKDINDDLNEIGNTLRRIYNDPECSFFSQSREQAYRLFNSSESNSEEQQNLRNHLSIDEDDELYNAVRAYLWHFYDSYDAYDQITFPVTYETQIGKASIIDVARISPLDATNLIDESFEKQIQKCLEAASSKGFSQERVEEIIDEINTFDFNQLERILNTLRNKFSPEQMKKIFRILTDNSENFQNLLATLEDEIISEQSEINIEQLKQEKYFEPIEKIIKLSKNGFILDHIEIIIELLKNGFSSKQIEEVFNVVEERKLKSGYKARRKVAGVTFRAFGAFFAGKWRENDILWGRLDGAERLVSIVLNSNLIPNETTENSDNGKNQENNFERPFIEMRDLIINELHSAILQESKLIKDACRKSGKNTEDLIGFVKNDYSIDRNLSKKEVMANTARSVKVLRKVAHKENLGTIGKISTSAGLYGIYILMLICTPGGTVSRIFNFFVFLFLAAGFIYIYKSPPAFQLNIIPGMELLLGIPGIGALVFAALLIFSGRWLISKIRNCIVNKISGN